MRKSKYNIVQRVKDQYFACNLLTGAIDKLDSDLGYYLESDIHDIPSEIKTYFRDRGYLYQSEMEEDKVKHLYKLYLSHLSANAPYVFQIIVTYACNFACPYCFQSKCRSRNGVLTSDQLDKIFSTINKITKRDNKTKVKPIIAPFGGEPLLPENKSILERLYAKTEQYGYVRGPIISNGYNIATFIDLFRTYKPSGLQITLDGYRDQHDQRRVLHNGIGTFDRIIDGIEMLLDEKIKVGLRVNLDHSSIKDLDKLARLIISKGWNVDECFSTYVVPVTNHICNDYKLPLQEHELLTKYYELKKDSPEISIFGLNEWTGLDQFIKIQNESIAWPKFHHCENCKGKTFHFDPYGDIYSCIEACGNSKYAIGRYEPKLEWYSDVRSKLKRNCLEMNSCESCKYSLICGGGCSYYAHLNYGSDKRGFCANLPKLIDTYIKLHYEEKWK